MIRVVITGSECTGKTTLAAALAEHYHTVWSPEYVRQFVADKGAAPESADVDAIARGQIATEDGMAAAAADVLILDTDLLSTLVYSHHYYGACPPWIEEAVQERPGDLYLLAGIDVPWVADGEQRDRGDRRLEMHELFRRALVGHQLPFIEVNGPTDARLRQAIPVIDPLLDG